MRRVVAESKLCESPKDGTKFLRSIISEAPPSAQVLTANVHPITLPAGGLQFLATVVYVCRWEDPGDDDVVIEAEAATLRASGGVVE